MKGNIRKLEQCLKAVANARRLYILSYIKKQKSATVSDIAGAAKLRLQSASQHMRILKSAGIVEHKKRGQYVSYRLSLKQEEPIKKVLQML